MGQLYCKNEDCGNRAVHFVETGPYCIDCFKDIVPMNFSDEDR